MTEPHGFVGGPVSVVEVGPLRLWSPVVLAPMAGVTDVPFRRLCRQFGESGLPRGLRPDEGNPTAPSGGDDAQIAWTKGVDAPAGLYVTEMVTSRALVENNERTWQMVQPDPLERVRSIQLYGVNPAVMAQATRLLIDRDLVDHIDLNFGCPVAKVTKKGGGAALPWKRDLLTDLVRDVVAAADDQSRRSRRNQPVPVTVKMRIGIDNDHETFREAAQIAQDAGVAAIALHARTQTQHYSGTAHWERIAELKDHVSIPVFGNGDIFEGPDALRMLEETGCDAVTIGRGCQGRPWLFRDIIRAFHGMPALPGPSLREVAEIIMTHARWVVEVENDEKRALREMRKHVGWYLRGFSVGGPQRHALGMVSTLDELEQRLSALDGDQEFPAAAQGARGRAGGEKTPHLPSGWLNSRCLTDAEREMLQLAELDVSGG
ncbi:tRNA dihydrouridine synthase DusB [Schaalia sp. ZJ1691]|uniref:tRNA dihydrouridine synthase DusB n=1 Tax=Schaalia sp. ZJ1691 TaxID=2709404 RepID=UPI0013EBD0AB|nr:tRNA dihydrouridine synthase DusB [Schaalia sp. ZJ1691]